MINLPLNLSKVAMDIDSLIEILNHKLIASQIRCLNTTEILLLRGIWQYKTYIEIAQEEDYSKGYISNVVAPGLCRRLSDLIGDRVTKKNCRVILENYITTEIKLDSSSQPKKSAPLIPQLPKDISPLFPQEEIIGQYKSPPYPNSALPINSQYYIPRREIEAQISKQITQPGALVRIKAPQEMGKTSLLLRILHYAQEQDYHTVNLNLQQTDSRTLGDFKLFLRWICANISRQLDIESKVDNYWDDDIGTSVSCMLYLEDYILDHIKTPLVLAFDEVNRIFEYPQVAQDFLPLLRSWFEEAKKVRIWENLRIIVVHSTEIYVPLQLTQSPFNVGLPVQLNCFNLEEVQELARRYELNWTDGKEAKQLMALVGGHPGLVQVALYNLHQDELTLTQLLKTAATTTGIYAHHLHRHWTNLQAEPELVRAFQEVISAKKSVELEPVVSHKLYSMGLIKLDNNKATLNCELYRRYFQKS
ncbi:MULTISPECIES: AAA-like domain-containing protein [Spirulina sp. CCY15215]|uniref:AAA-like domain-containing protein n=1 Tax=Spirulina sp. CCY15215 TaxID=2767591 RepID=UPI00194E5C77|nr:AAA-like domain-containing protein [Spirulina major]